MTNNATGTRPAPASSKIPAPALKPDAAQHAAGLRSSPSGSPSDSVAKHSGYGLPCAKCHLYYPADLDVCPTCHHKERVSPVAPKVKPKVSQAATPPVPDNATVEKEREEFLRQFKSNLIEAHNEIVQTSGTVCSCEQHRPGDEAAATICHACFERVRERLDLLETALVVDPKEAAQIIYAAVWADPSDPSKTYENAANALLSEIRKRAGMNPLMGPFQPLSD
jgi:hypothetical protein